MTPLNFVNTLVDAGRFYFEGGADTEYIARDSQAFYDTLINILIGGCTEEVEVFDADEIQADEQFSAWFADAIAEMSEEGETPKLLRAKVGGQWCSFLVADEPCKEYCLIKTTYSGKEIEVAGWRNNGLSYDECWEYLLAEDAESCNDYVTPMSSWCVYDNRRVNQDAFSDDDFDNEAPAYVEEVKQAAEMTYGELSGYIGDNYYKFVEVEKS